MIKLEEIKKFYPEALHPYAGFLLKEYLQYKILEIVFNTENARKLIFMGDTVLRIIHDNQRFSEDLDFDNFGASIQEFQDLGLIIKKKLGQEGYEVEIKVIEKNAYHCYIRFPEILFREKLTGHMEQKILIQLDTEPESYKYHPEIRLLNKFDVFTEVPAVPLPILLSQKFYAILNRARNKGRDFFDIAYLMSLNIRPDFDYLNQKVGISSKEQLIDAVLDHCEKLNMDFMAEDVKPFLFHPSDSQKVKRFPELFRQYFI